MERIFSFILYWCLTVSFLWLTYNLYVWFYVVP